MAKFEYGNINQPIYKGAVFMSTKGIISSLLMGLVSSASLDLRVISEISSRQALNSLMPILRNDIPLSSDGFKKTFHKKEFFLKNNNFFRKNTGRQFKIRRTT